MAEKAGGSSRKPKGRDRENGDASDDSERPLKKARFAWQVKGKYHLKNDTDTSDSCKTTTVESVDSDAAGSSNSGSISNDMTETDRLLIKELEALKNILKNKQDADTSDSENSDTDSGSINRSHQESHMEPSTSVSTHDLKQIAPEMLINPGHGSSYERYSYGLTNVGRLFRQPELASEVDTEEKCIARWQARQMAIGFLDNSINSILEGWEHITIQSPENEVANFINNLPGDRSVENEAILMAISAHGLQNNEPTNNVSHSVLMSLSPDPSESQDDDQDELPPEINNNNYFNNQVSHIYNDCIRPYPWIWSQVEYNYVPFSGHRQQTPNPVSHNYYGTPPPDSLDSIESINFGNSLNINPAHNDDFLDAAVTFAIQSKGLTTTSATDYG